MLNRWRTLDLSITLPDVVSFHAFPHKVPVYYAMFPVSRTGSAYIFKKSETPGDPNRYEWVKLTPSDGEADGNFGCSVSVSGGYAIVGACLDDSRTGSAYVFENVCEPERTFVQIDIKPGSCPNPLNVRSRGVLPLAILGTDELDVSDIEPTSVRLEGVAPLRWSYEDAATPTREQDECACTGEGSDGCVDLTLQFETQATVEALGELADGRELVLELTRELHDGTPILGEDCVVIRPKSDAKPK